MSEDRRSWFEQILVRVTPARVLLLFTFHAIVFSAAYGFAYLVRFEFAIPPEFHSTIRASFAVVVGVQLLVGLLFSFYRGWWRYVGIADVIRLVAGLTTSLALLLALYYLGGLLNIRYRFTHTPRGVLLIDWAFALLTLFGARVAVRLGRDRLRIGDDLDAPLKRVLIVGAGDAGETLAREIEHRPQLGMKVVGFIDDQRGKWGSHIRGIRVSGPIAEIGRIAESSRASEVFIAIPSASGKRLRDILRSLAESNLQFKTMPGIDQLVSGKVHVTQLRPVNVEDLLRRDRIELPGDPVRALFRGKRVLITGSGGTIGSELAAQIVQFEPDSLALVERSEYALYEVHKRLLREAPWSASRVSCNLVDVGDTSNLDRLIREIQPHIVVHAAAHKHVPLGEENPAEYLRNNTLAARSLAEICVKAGVRRFVFISTDKAINPTSVMGASKRAAEIALLDAARGSEMKLTIVRFGNVIGSSGSVVPLFIEQIAAGGPITVTHADVTRYFIRTSEAVSLVLQAATLGGAGRIYMLDMGEPIKVAELARDLIRLSNHTEEEIAIVYTGLRPGEKLFEEIRLEGEFIHPTIHPQIVVTESPQPDPATVATWLHAAAASSAQTTRLLLQDLVVEFAPAPCTESPVPVKATPSPALPGRSRPLQDIGMSTR